MKRVTILTLCLCVLLSVAGCGANLWAYTDESVDSLGVRGGLTADRFEFGAENVRDKYDEGSGDWDPYFIIYALPGESVNPYVGASSDNLKIGDESDLEPFYGIKVDPIFVEYKDRTDDFYFGLQTGWRW